MLLYSTADVLQERPSVKYVFVFFSKTVMWINVPKIYTQTISFISFLFVFFFSPFLGGGVGWGGGIFYFKIQDILQIN